MTITRYNIGTRHHNGIGFPGEMVKQADGEYVRYADHLESLHEAHRQIAALSEDYADMAAKNAELERQLGAIGAGGVSPLMGSQIDRQGRGEPVAWIHEDELPDSYPYDEMFAFSKVDGVRLFPVFWPETMLTPGYIDGHRDGLEWAAQLAEANHPLTSDWLYDDPHDLAKAIRKGPEMPPVEPQPADPTIKESLTVAEPVKEASDEELAMLFGMWGWKTKIGRELRFAHFKEMVQILLDRYGRKS